MIVVYIMYAYLLITVVILHVRNVFSESDCYLLAKERSIPVAKMCEGNEAGSSDSIVLDVTQAKAYDRCSCSLYIHNAADDNVGNERVQLLIDTLDSSLKPSYKNCNTSMQIESSSKTLTYECATESAEVEQLVSNRISIFYRAFSESYVSQYCLQFSFKERPEKYLSLGLMCESTHIQETTTDQQQFTGSSMNTSEMFYSTSSTTGHISSTEVSSSPMSSPICNNTCDPKAGVIISVILAALIILASAVVHMVLFLKRQKSNTESKQKKGPEPEIAPDLPSYQSLRRYESSGINTYDDLKYPSPLTDYQRMTDMNLNTEPVVTVKGNLTTSESMNYENIDEGTDEENQRGNEYVNENNRKTEKGSVHVDVKTNPQMIEISETYEDTTSLNEVTTSVTDSTDYLQPV